ncbi:MAG: BlaI/MecI/CopY family transcriptional regulator [bacterium]|nr:BlaI/MecI/CopY family transcriptional regulator [bacterium]
MKRNTLTEAELEIMQVVWELGRATVRQVHAVINEQRQLAYTTVMTMMNILEEKGHLTKSKSGRAFVYEPAHSKGHVVSTMVDDFVDRVFGGSARPLVMNLVKDSKLSRKDLEEIARMIKESD